MVTPLGLGMLWHPQSAHLLLVPVTFLPGGQPALGPRHFGAPRSGLPLWRHWHRFAIIYFFNPLWPLFHRF